MAAGADVKSLESISKFRAAVLNFQQEARLCLQALESQTLKFMGWLERERPGFWKRQVELSYREHGEARTSFHRCRMRKMGDFKPTCYEERKAMEAAKQALEFAQKQLPVVKFWIANAHHEANEYKGRSAQVHQFIERDLPELLALLAHSIQQLEAYANVTTGSLASNQLAKMNSAEAAEEDTTGADEKEGLESKPNSDCEVNQTENSHDQPSALLAVDPPDQQIDLDRQAKNQAGDVE